MYHALAFFLSFNYFPLAEKGFEFCGRYQSVKFKTVEILKNQIFLKMIKKENLSSI